MSQVSVVIPTYKRRSELAVALSRIIRCRPAPAEIIVHVDGGDWETEPWLRAEFPAVKVLTSEDRVGPGGGRNKLVAAARNDVIASFDDDSYPLDTDYFARLSEVFLRRPDAVIIASQIVHRGESVPDATATVGPSVLFVGCGTAYRRQVFLEFGGYVPLLMGYGMEEVDLAIRLACGSKKIYFTPWLRVFHDTDLSHHGKSSVTAASVSNLALLTYLRYPIRYWPFGLMQVFNRILWLIRARRLRGIAMGLSGIPAHLWRHRRFRKPVSPSGLAAFLRARKLAVPLESLAVYQEQSTGR
jgi:GT2 family glycosyltransferase